MGSGADKRRLASIVRECGALVVVVAVDIALDVCEALVPLHAQGGVHGDLGPDGILIPWPRTATSGPAEIFAVPAQDATYDPPFTFGAASRNDRDYAAPEQRGAMEGVDARADIWAVGALLDRMIAGPRSGASGVAQASGVPSALSQAISACLARDRGGRPPSIVALFGTLAAFASEPAVRFERLARLRAISGLASTALVDPRARAALVALDRLDQAAIVRELAAGRAPAPPVVLAPPQTILPPRALDIDAAALAPLWSLADEISDEHVAYAGGSASLAPVTVASVASPSMAPVLISVPVSAPSRWSVALGPRHLPLLAYAAALAVSAIVGFRFASARAMSTAAREASMALAPPAALASLPPPPHGAPETLRPSADAGVPAASPAAAPPLSTPRALPDAVSASPRLRATRAPTPLLPRSAPERLTAPERRDDPVLSDSDRR